MPETRRTPLILDRTWNEDRVSDGWELANGHSQRTKLPTEIVTDSCGVRRTNPESTPEVGLATRLVPVAARSDAERKL